jgi:Glyoxalase-like domain
VAVSWVSAFLDLAPGDFDAGVAFWRGVTGYGLSSPRGEQDEFATLVPPDGDDFLRVQRLGDGPSRLHLDLDDPDHEFAVHRSPGGLTWCSVSHGASVRPRPATWPGGHASLVDQVCLDIPADTYDVECDFWAGLTGWELRQGSRPEFRVLVRAPGQPLRLLLQRLDEPTGPVRAHLDLATTDRTAETARHLALGARVRGHGPAWTVLADPVGSSYCITDRDPETGMLATHPSR